MSEESLPPALSPGQTKDLIKRRFLAHIGWDGSKLVDSRRLVTRPICSIGHAGIGKSEVPYQAAEELSELLAVAIGQKVQVRMTNLQFCELPDFMGLPYNTEEISVDYSKRVMRTKHGVPEILPQDGYGIWFLDEPNRAGRDIRSGLLTLLQARQVNGVPLGKNWMIVLAMNPAEADGQSYEVATWDGALQDRIAPVNFTPSHDEFYSFISKKYGASDPVVRWIEKRGKDVVNFKGEGRCTPRGLEFLIRAIRSENFTREAKVAKLGEPTAAFVEVSGIESPNFWNTAAAEIGMSAANAFNGFLQESLFLKAEEIIDSYGPEVREKIEYFESAGRVDVLNSVTEDLATIVVAKMEALGERWPSEAPVKVGEKPTPINFMDPRFDEFRAFISNVALFLEESTNVESGHSFTLAICDKTVGAPGKARFHGMMRYFIEGAAPTFISHYRALKKSMAQGTAA